MSSSKSFWISLVAEALRASGTWIETMATFIESSQNIADEVQVLPDRNQDQLQRRSLSKDPTPDSHGRENSVPVVPLVQLEPPMLHENTLQYSMSPLLVEDSQEEQTDSFNFDASNGQDAMEDSNPPSVEGTSLDPDLCSSRYEHERDNASNYMVCNLFMTYTRLSRSGLSFHTI